MTAKNVRKAFHTRLIFLAAYLATEVQKLIFIPEAKQNILDLAHECGFEDLNERNMQLQAESSFDEETEPFVSKQLTLKNISKAFFLFRTRNILLENDPDIERSDMISRGVNTAISCYKLLKNDKRRRRTMLDNFYKPDPFLPAKNYDDSD